MERDNHAASTAKCRVGYWCNRLHSDLMHGRLVQQAWFECHSNSNSSSSNSSNSSVQFRNQEQAQQTLIGGGAAAKSIVGTLPQDHSIPAVSRQASVVWMITITTTATDWQTLLVGIGRLCNGMLTLCTRLTDVKTRTKRRYWTELSWHGLVFDKLTNGQAVMHYSRHRLTASMACMTSLKFALTNDQ